MLWNSISKIFDIEFHNIKRNDIDLGGDINLQMISPLLWPYHKYTLYMYVIVLLFLNASIALAVV